MVEISVYMPTRNRAALLPRAVASIVAQTHQDWELIVVDDASDDQTPALLEAFAANDPRIRYFRQPSPQGACVARNLAIENARGTYMTGLDDDDQFMPTRLDDLVAPARAGAAIVSGYDLFWSPGGVRKIRRPLKISYSMMLTRNYIGNQMLTRRDHLLEIGGFDPIMPALQDYDTWTRLMKRFGEGVAVPKFNHLLYGNLDVYRISTDPTRQRNGWRLYYERHSADMTFRNRQMHQARRTLHDSRGKAVLQAASGLDLTSWGLKELARIAVGPKMR